MRESVGSWRGGPPGSLERLPRWRYHLAKAVLFPGRLPYAALQSRVVAVNEALADLGARPGITLIEPRPEW